jgi:selenocysteine-specific elongation factor
MSARAGARLDAGATAREPPPDAPLTVGTAGHVDHGKTALVAALTGVDTDRLPEEKRRGLTIALGYAPLLLPSGRQLSLIDVPGHERFVRTMVAGASGIDLFLMVVAADDGVMPQTIEHARVLRALGVRDGVVGITKSDLADPEPASLQARELLPGSPVIACSSRSGAGLASLRTALEQLAGRVPSRAASPAPARLHIDRVFTLAGRGTVVTGTLWSGSIGRGDELHVLPSRRRVRVREVHVHDLALERARAGQRVAVNLAGVKSREVARGEVLSARASLQETKVIDCALALREARHGASVQVHHGTRALPARLAWLADDLWQVRLAQPLLAIEGDRVVVRSVAPPDTLGGGVILDASARRHGRRPELIARLQRLRDGGDGADDAALAGSRSANADGAVAGSRSRGSAIAGARAHEDPDPRALAELERRLHDAGAGLLSEAQLDASSAELRALRADGRAVRVSGRLYAHGEVLGQVQRRVTALIEAEGSVTLGSVRDALGLSRKSAQAFLEHLDGARVTRRLPDDRRVLAPGRQERAPA